MAVFVKWDINWICWSRDDCILEDDLRFPNWSGIVRLLVILDYQTKPVLWRLKTTKTDLAGSIVQLNFFSENNKSAQKEMKHKHKPYAYPLRSQLFWWNMNFPAPHIINMHKYYLRYLKVKAKTLNTCSNTSWTKKKSNWPL